MAYSHAFDFVEINSTFYEMPNLGQVETWRRIVPQDFEFAVRCNKALTHRHKFQPTPEACGIMETMIAVCRALRAEILHFQTPPRFEPSRTNARLIRDFLSSIDLQAIRVALEIREVSEPISSDFLKTMQDYNVIHCVDLSKNEEPAYESDILYSRLFGKGAHNIYQPTDEELMRIDGKASSGDHKAVAISFHFVRMYKDAARFQIYKRTGKFPMATESTGQRSLVEVLEEDAKFPSNRRELIQHQGWKLIDLTEEKRVHAAQMLQKLPEKTYNSITEVVQALNATEAR